MGMKSGRIDLPEGIWVEILARLPFRSVVRFKGVCKGWRQLIESAYFRGVFVFAHRKSSSSWSIMLGTFGWSSREAVGFYGCERYGLPRTLDTYIPPNETTHSNSVIACADGLVLLQSLSNQGDMYFVGNPVLSQWVQLPHHPLRGTTTSLKAIGLVTRMEDNVVVEYKVVFMDDDFGFEVESLSFDIYSSKTGIWTLKNQVRCPCLIVSLCYQRCLSLNTMLHILDDYRGSRSDVGAIVAYDLYADDDEQQCRVIPFPDEKACFRRAYTTSGGFLIYMNKINLLLRLWRLEEYTSDSGRWQSMQEINLSSFGCDHSYFPLTMHPFETHIIYMGTPDKALASIDFKAHKLTHYTRSSTYRDTMLFHYLDVVYQDVDHRVFYAPQFTLPKWMGPVPLPPSL